MDAGIVHEAVDPAEALDAQADHRLGGLGGTDGVYRQDGLASGCLDLLDHRL
jgi:hypothetical protein